MKQGWETKKIGDVCEICNGGTPDTKVKQYWGEPHLWITPKDMGKLESKFVEDTERKISDLGLKNSSAKILPKNSIILSSRAPIGHLAIATKEIATNQGCKGLVPKKNIHSLYLYYYLKNSVDLLNSLGSGTTFKELSSSKLADVDIPVPPLPEQQRIVAILDEAFAAIATAKANAEKNLQNSRELFETYLNNIFTNTGDGWKLKRLEDVCIVERGSSPRPIKEYLTQDDTGVNWIKIGDTKNIKKYICATKEKITPEGAKKSRFVKVGDFILSNSMSFGKPYIMKTQGYIHDGWFVLRLPDYIDTEFFWYLLSSPYILNQFNSLASGAIVKNISGDLVKKVLLPFPSINEQKSLVKKLDGLSKKIIQLEVIYQQKLKEIEELKKSILQKAFNGELTGV